MAFKYTLKTRLKILQSPCPRRDALEFINKVEFYILCLLKVLQGILSYSKVPEVFGAHILDLGTIGFVASGLGQLNITYN